MQAMTFLILCDGNKHLYKSTRERCGVFDKVDIKTHCTSFYALRSALYAHNMYFSYQIQRKKRYTLDMEDMKVFLEYGKNAFHWVFFLGFKHTYTWAT